MVDPLLFEVLPEFLRRSRRRRPLPGIEHNQRAITQWRRIRSPSNVPLDEIAFDSGVFLLRKATAEALRRGAPPPPPPGLPEPKEQLPAPGVPAHPLAESETRIIRVVGNVPAELWNRFGTKVLPKLRTGSDLKVGVEFSVSIKSDGVANLSSELRQILQDLGLSNSVRVE